MFKQERVIPAISLLVFTIAVVGLVSGYQPVSGGSLPPLVEISVLFLVYVLGFSAGGLTTTGRKPKRRTEWAGHIAGSLLLALFTYAEFASRQGDGQQTGFFFLCGGFLILVCIYLALLDVLRKRGEEEPAGNPQDNDIRV